MTTTMSVDWAPFPTFPGALFAGELILLGCWLLLLVFLARAWPKVRAATGEEAWLRDRTAALTAFAILLRGLLAPLTPEMRWRLGFAYSPVGIVDYALHGTATVLGIEDVQKYGLGWPLVARVAVVLFGQDYAVPFWINPVIGGLAVAPMVGLVRAVGGSASTALWAGFCVAVTPMLVWFSHTDGPFPSDAFFTLLTLWATARYAVTHHNRYLAIGVAAVVTTAQMRIESATTGLAAVGLALAMADRFPFRRPAPYVAAVVAALLLIPHAILVGPALRVELGARFGEPSGPLQLTPYNFLVFNPTMQAEVLIAALPLGLLFGPVRWPVRVWAAVMMMAIGATLPDVVPSETAFSVARYQLRALPFAALLAGLGAAWLASLPLRRPLVALFLLGAAFGLRKAATVSVMKTEHDFFLAHFDEVPSPCTIMTWRSQGDTTLFVPLHLSRLWRKRHTWLDIVRDPVPTEGCVWYYMSGGCTQHYRTLVDNERHEACAAFEAAWQLEPVSTAELEPDPVGPMGITNRLPGVPIPVGFYRVVGPAAGG